MTRAIRIAATAITLLLIVAMWVTLVLAYPGLPARVPTHFGIDGRADGYGPRSSLFLTPLVATVVCCFLFAATRIARGRPNLPFAIPPAAMPLALAGLRAFMATQALMVAALFFVIQRGTFAAATGGSAGLGPGLLLAVGAYEVGAIAIFFGALYRLRG